MRAERTVQKIATAAALGLWLLAGCKSPTPPKILETPTAKPKPATFFDPATLGSIRGVVNFTGGAPAPALIATSTDHACTPAGELFSEEYSVHDGKLANVYAYIKTGPPAAMTQGASWMDPVVLDQQRCRFIPHVIAVTAGQRIAFRNDDPTTQTIHATPAIAGNAPIDLSLAPNAPPQMRFFRKPEPMIPVRSSQHPWQSAYINVSPTPWFAVTGPDGSFELKGLPAGVYTLGLIHEKLGEQTISITVKPQTTANAAVTYRMK
jgi:plastocyanin